MSILVIGESLIDSVVTDGESTRCSPGGSPMNVAVGLSRLGHEVTFATQIGEDDDGEMIVDCLGRDTHRDQRARRADEPSSRHRKD